MLRIAKETAAEAAASEMRSSEVVTLAGKAGPKAGKAAAAADLRYSKQLAAEKCIYYNE